MKKENNDKNYRSISNEIEKIARLLRLQVQKSAAKPFAERKVTKSPANAIEQVAKLLREQIKKQ